MARPKKDELEKRTQQCNLRLTIAELAHIQDQASAAGLEVSEFIRRRAVGYTVPSGKSRRTDPALITELNRVGVNVNQLAKASHTGRDFVQYWTEIGQELEDILERLTARQGS